jgi:hypothetical protein
MLTLFSVIGGYLLGQDLMRAAECRNEIKELSIQDGVSIDVYKTQHPDAVKECGKRKL